MTLEEMELKLHDLKEQKENLEAEIKTLQEQHTALLLEPFHAGDDAVCRLPNNKNLKNAFKGKIEIVGDTVYIIPYKNDGSLSGRHYMVALEENKTYADYFQKG